MPIRLRREEVVTIKVLSEKGENHCQVARLLGVSEGAVRYHLRQAAGATDGRAGKPFLPLSTRRVRPDGDTSSLESPGSTSMWVDAQVLREGGLGGECEEDAGEEIAESGRPHDRAPAPWRRDTGQ